MSTDFTFPLALCKAQWGIWLHTLEMLQLSGVQCLSLGSHALQDGIAQTRSEAHGVMQAEDWQALAAAQMDALWRTAGYQAASAFALWPACRIASPGRTVSQDSKPAPVPVAGASGNAAPRRVQVQGALRTLSAALAAPAGKKARRQAGVTNGVVAGRKASSMIRPNESPATRRAPGDRPKPGP